MSEEWMQSVLVELADQMGLPEHLARLELNDRLEELSRDYWHGTTPEDAVWPH